MVSEEVSSKGITGNQNSYLYLCDKIIEMSMEQSQCAPVVKIQHWCIDMIDELNGFEPGEKNKYKKLEKTGDQKISDKVLKEIKYLIKREAILYDNFMNKE